MRSPTATVPAIFCHIEWRLMQIICQGATKSKLLNEVDSKARLCRRTPLNTHFAELAHGRRGCWASCPVTHGGCRQSAACYWAWCLAMQQVSADSTLLGIMPSNGPMYFFLWCTMSHYFKICDFGNPFDKNECHELFRGPFKIQISVSIDFRMQTNENEQVFLTLSRFWWPYWTSLWEEICNVKRSKDSVRKK